MQSCTIEPDSRQPVAETEARPPETALARYLEKLLDSDQAPPDQAPSQEAPGPSSQPADVDRPNTPMKNGRVEVPARRKAFGMLRRWRDRSLLKARRSGRSGNVGLRRKPRMAPPVSRQGARDIRRRIMGMLIPILAITLFAVLKRSVGTPASAEAARAEPKTAGSPAPAPVQITWAIPPLYEPHGRDPMRLPSPPAEVQETQTPLEEPVIELLVTGILHSNDRPAAIVNTQVVREGQQIAGTTVVKIDTDGVEFERNGRTWRQTVRNAPGGIRNP